ncbi:winged helix-turn-helix transcriptional regulator [Ramlibacter sp. AW1]|uniref:Winged helix-turn-helix transcriptional regulator n=1 Tax=Ramlibacter aurantiacus TaxID=2801330 RepID=A0A937D4Q3_9BURK|nr:MarR family winged helix-turn-helix transcriptional regulator [Ramlibacter aurantiacus]MBL0421955.1 winged helix-turn-helix transcriptional regulator [Ramlibacter aurantiacus]
MRHTVDDVNQPPVASADDVIERIHAVMHLYRSRQHRALRDGGEGVTHLEMRVLGFFARHPGAGQSELVAHSGRDKGQLARLVAGLRERGLLEARADESDRRIQRLFLTEPGQQAWQVLRRQGRKLAAVAVKGLSETERGRLAGLLDRLLENLGQAED